MKRNDLTENEDTHSRRDGSPNPSPRNDQEEKKFEKCFLEITKGEKLSRRKATNRKLGTSEDVQSLSGIATNREYYGGCLLLHLIYT